MAHGEADDLTQRREGAKEQGKDWTGFPKPFFAPLREILLLDRELQE